MRQYDDERDMLLVTLVILAAMFATVMLCTSCVTDPSQWKQYEHSAMARACRVACHPGRLAKYDSMDGSCECAVKKP